MDNEYSELIAEIITLANELDVYDKEASSKFNTLMAVIMILTMASGGR